MESFLKGNIVLQCPYGKITRILDGDEYPKAVGINTEKMINKLGSMCRVNEKAYQNSKCS